MRYFLLFDYILIIDNHYYIYILEIIENYLLSHLTIINNQKVELIKRNIIDLKDYERDDSIIIVIDDDPRNLKEIDRLNEDIILLKDTVLID